MRFGGNRRRGSPALGHEANQFVRWFHVVVAPSLDWLTVGLGAFGHHIEDSRWSEFLALRRLDDSRLRVLHHRPAGTGPDTAHRFEEPLGLALSVELQVDHHVVRVFNGAEDLEAAYTVSLAVCRIAVEGGFPAFVVGNG